MQPAEPISQGFDRLRSHEGDIRSAEGSNEDTTRMRAIDTIVFSVLGWDRPVVETEKYCRGVGDADYVFSSGKVITLVLEAKRSGKTFLLKGRSYPKRPVSFDLIAEECPAAEAAMGQAIGYAAQLGASAVFGTI